MSYLDVPRLHFAGRFGADVSTVNNTLSNFRPRTTQPSPAWNPNGTGAWTLEACAVTSVVYGDGTVADHAATDPVVGSPVSGNSGTAAKLVDLDPQQQMVSEIWGLTVSVGPEGSAVAGGFEVAAFVDLWQRSPASSGDQPLSAYYQSTLRDLDWGDGKASRFLTELAAASPAALSIKFVVDGYNFAATGGRVVGTIGPVKRYEPDHFVAGRLLRGPRGATNPLNFAPCRIDKARKVVLLDLGNSIPTTTPGGPPVSLGELQLAILPGRAKPVPLGPIHYSATDYTQRALIQEFPVTTAQIKQLQSTPLGVIDVPPAGPPSSKPISPASAQVLLTENADGSYVRADQFVYRLNPGQPKPATVRLWATRYGIPASGQEIQLHDSTSSLRSSGLGVPAGALSYPAGTPPTDRYGRTSFPVSGTGPGNPRRFIDGQLYGIGYSWGQDNRPDRSNFISVLLHDSFPMRPPVTYAQVKPILDQYAKLYPYMTQNIVDLSSLTAIRKFGPANIAAVMSRPRSDPGFMPVTRDLSADKTCAIVGWLQAGAPD